MKNVPRIAMLCALLCTCTSLQAQYSCAPQPPAYSITTQAGATLDQIIDTMLRHANPNDTGEGGELDQIKQFCVPAESPPSGTRRQSGN